MATQTNPYADMMNAWTQNFKAPQFSVPSFDMSNVVTFGRRNAEAATAASQCLAESAQTISRRQAELARAQVEKCLKTAKDMLVSGSPEINVNKQVELAKSAFETSLNNLREVSELVTKSGFEAFDVLNKRASACIEEATSIGGHVATAVKKKAAA